ncbi:hypothetical protein TpMuguga_02g00814 [Theileria parva strain Muguga]|uniref:Uncharacterized protein n=1 Tax=Theileria parva TaxID=5875 RepID=Q4N424_THEPA|nr:uncharacterized protein TpMuguga_02g00814 [Theileria parva strain Muguga]EAN33099.1 hypothetical protein TpMuguga_02g00814 [Theileria parva strain Muguga]|eukprot:XP_765382.1 hypothetical protein [Theileria parva strain Muguga]
MRIICVLIFVEIITCFNTNSIDYKLARFRVYSKNPPYDKKRREQRRSKRLKQVLPAENIALEMKNQAMISRALVMQNQIFGPRLSQVPGDGGKIPDLEESRDKYTHVKNYYSSYYNTYIDKNAPSTVNKFNTTTNTVNDLVNAGNTTMATSVDTADTNDNDVKKDNYGEFFNNEAETINKILKDPNATFGEFEGQKPAVKRPFYKEFEGFHPDSSYIRATMKRSIAAYKDDIEEDYEGTQSYCGLKYETLLSHLTPENMELVRQMEIEVKQGELSPDNPILDLDIDTNDEMDDEFYLNQ